MNYSNKTHENNDFYKKNENDKNDENDENDENDVNITNQNRSTNHILGILIKNNDLDVIFENILMAKIVIKEDDIIGILTYLIKKGVNVNKKIDNNAQGYLNLIIASSLFKKRYQVIKLLLKSGSKFDHYTKQNPLHCVNSIYIEHIDNEINKIIDALILHGIDIDSLNSENATSLNIASFMDHEQSVKTMKYLINKKANVNNVIFNGNNCLHLSILKSNEILAREKIILLINNGCDINCQNNLGNTPLYLAIEKFKKKSTDIIEIFLKNGASLFFKNNKNKTCYDLLDKNMKNNYELIIKSNRMKFNTCNVCLVNGEAIVCPHNHAICYDCLKHLNKFNCLVCEKKLLCEINLLKNNNIINVTF